MSCGCTDRDRKGSKARNVGEFDRKRGVRERESSAGESFEVIHSFDNSRIKQNNLLRLTLVEVGEVDGGRTRSPGGAESRQERTLKGIPVVAVDAAAFQCIKPPESVAAESVEDEGHRLISRPGRGRTGTRNPFNPLFGGELIQNKTQGKRGEKKNFLKFWRQYRVRNLTEYVEVVIRKIELLPIMKQDVAG